MMKDKCLVSKELVNVIEITDKSIKNKIPKEIIEFFQKEANLCNKEIILEKGKSLSEQNISEDCKKLLSVIYYRYLINKDTKKELMNKWIKNG